MKKLLLAVVLMFPALAVAQSEYKLTWSIVGKISPAAFDTIVLDIRETSRFLTANGIFKSGSAAATATGTCFFLASGNVYCGLNVSAATYSIEITPSLNGTVIYVDSDTGGTASSAALQLVEFN